MSVTPPLQTIAVGVVVERTKGVTQWSEFAWRPVSVLTGAPATPPWTKLSDDGERATFFAGIADIELYRTETTYYRAISNPGRRLCGSRCAPPDTEPPFVIAVVTADPAEGESLTEPATDMIEQVPMPEAIQQLVAAFVAEHHVEQPFVKRKRDRADPEALGRRSPHARR